ncbi:MAG: hypothetical protein ACTSYG_10830 [Candidatus Heimdallarchaeota archaeon]
MAKRNTIPQRIDPDFIKEMKELAKMRYFKNLAKREPSFSEMTTLLRRTQGWSISKEELKTKPKRENQK